MQNAANGVFRFGSFLLDSRERTLTRNGSAIPLPPKIFDTLVMLVENAGHMVSKDELLNRLWPDSAVEENSLNKNVSALRKVLAEDGLHWIEAVPKYGYRFTADVSAVAPAERSSAASGDDRRPSGSSSAPYIGPIRLRWRLAAAGAVCIGLALWALFRMNRIASLAPVIEFSISAPRNTVLTSPYVRGNVMAISPNGRALVFSASPPGGPTMLWIRWLDERSAAFTRYGRWGIAILVPR